MMANPYSKFLWDDSPVKGFSQAIEEKANERKAEVLAHEDSMEIVDPDGDDVDLHISSPENLAREERNPFGPSASTGFGHTVGETRKEKTETLNTGDDQMEVENTDAENEDFDIFAPENLGRKEMKSKTKDVRESIIGPVINEALETAEKDDESDERSSPKLIGEQWGRRSVFGALGYFCGNDQDGQVAGISSQQQHDEVPTSQTLLDDATDGRRGSQEIEAEDIENLIREVAPIDSITNEVDIFQEEIEESRMQVDEIPSSNAETGDVDIALLSQLSQQPEVEVDRGKTSIQVVEVHHPPTTKHDMESEEAEKLIESQLSQSLHNDRSQEVFLFDDIEAGFEGEPCSKTFEAPHLEVQREDSTPFAVEAQQDELTTLEGKDMVPDLEAGHEPGADPPILTVDNIYDSVKADKISGGDRQDLARLFRGNARSLADAEKPEEDQSSTLHAFKHHKKVREEEDNRINYYDDEVRAVALDLTLPDPDTDYKPVTKTAIPLPSIQSRKQSRKQPKQDVFFSLPTEAPDEFYGAAKSYASDIIQNFAISHSFYNRAKKIKTGLKRFLSDVYDFAISKGLENSAAKLEALKAKTAWVKQGGGKHGELLDDDAINNLDVKIVGDEELYPSNHSKKDLSDHDKRKKGSVGFSGDLEVETYMLEAPPALELNAADNESNHRLQESGGKRKRKALSTDVKDEKVFAKKARTLKDHGPTTTAEESTTVRDKAWYSKQGEGEREEADEEKRERKRLKKEKKKAETVSSHFPVEQPSLTVEMKKSKKSKKAPTTSTYFSKLEVKDGLIGEAVSSVDVMEWADQNNDENQPLGKAQKKRRKKENRLAQQIAAGQRSDLPATDRSTPIQVPAKQGSASIHKGQVKDDLKNVEISMKGKKSSHGKKEHKSSSAKTTKDLAVNPSAHETFENEKKPENTKRARAQAKTRRGKRKTKFAEAGPAAEVDTTELMNEIVDTNAGKTNIDISEKKKSSEGAKIKPAKVLHS